MKTDLTTGKLQEEAKVFSEIEIQHHEPKLYGVTDGKAVGTYLEHKFQSHLSSLYNYKVGSSAKGIDFPELGIDMKVTSIKQPQSSCPFKSGKQKVFGLGYSIIVFVYEKSDDHVAKAGNLNIHHVVFIEKHRTADFQLTSAIVKIIENDGNEDDIIALMQDRFLPIDDIVAQEIAEEVLKNPPPIGYLTISNALQWRLQYKRVITKAGNVEGIIKVK